MNVADTAIAFRLALRELRGGLSGFYVFVACIALGVAAIAGVNSVSRALTEGISSEGRVILGGDIAFSFVQREASPEELRFFQSKGRVGVIASLRAMVRSADESNTALVELKAVDAAYPHGGTLRLEDGSTDGQSLMAAKDGIYGALVAPELLDRLAREKRRPHPPRHRDASNPRRDPLRARPAVERPRLRAALHRLDRRACRLPDLCGPEASSPGPIACGSRTAPTTLPRSRRCGRRRTRSSRRPAGTSARATTPRRA